MGFYFLVKATVNYQYFNVMKGFREFESHFTGYKEMTARRK